MWKPVVVIVPTALDLTKCLEIAGQGGSVILPVFFFGAASPLKSNEVSSLLFRNVGKDFTDAL